MFKITKVLALILLITFTSINSQFLANVNELTPVNAEEFVKGYINGIGLFQDVTANSTCIQNAEIITEDAVTLFNILKDLKVDVHIISNVKEIVVAVQSIISHIKVEEPACKAASALALNDVKRLIERMGRDGYVKELGSHTWENVSEIEGMVQDGIASITSEKIEEAGMTFGKATRFVAFWDLE